VHAHSVYQPFPPPILEGLGMRLVNGLHLRGADDVMYAVCCCACQLHFIALFNTPLLFSFLPPLPKPSSTSLPTSLRPKPLIPHWITSYLIVHYIHMAGGEIPGNYHDLWLKRRSHMPLSLHHMSTVTSCCTWVVAVSIWYCLPRAKVTSPHVQQCIGCSMTHKWLCTASHPNKDSLVSHGNWLCWANFTYSWRQQSTHSDSQWLLHQLGSFFRQVCCTVTTSPFKGCLWCFTRYSASFKWSYAI